MVDDFYKHNSTYNVQTRSNKRIKQENGDRQLRVTFAKQLCVEIRDQKDPKVVCMLSNSNVIAWS